jgi:ribonuclease T2
MVLSTDNVYVLAYSWTPGFCINQSYPGCKKPESYWLNHFTLHGLWPQYITTGYPSYCTTESYNSSIPDAIGMSTMIQYWPDVKYDITSSSYDSFWEHEWTKHGTCSTLTQYNYFNDAIQLIERFQTPEVLVEAAGGNIDAATLRKSMGDVALQCSGGNVLMGAYTCWSQTNGIPDSQITCPSSVEMEDTCSATTLTVPSLD